MWFFKLALAFLLSPGVLLTLPPGSKGVFFSRQTSLLAAAVHALVFVFISHVFWVWYTTGAIDLIVARFEMFESGSGNPVCSQPGLSFCPKTGHCQKSC